MAVAKTRLLKLPREAFEELAKRDPSVAHSLLAALARVRAERLR